MGKNESSSINHRSSRHINLNLVQTNLQEFSDLQEDKNLKLLRERYRKLIRFNDKKFVDNYFDTYDNSEVVNNSE